MTGGRESVKPTIWMGREPARVVPGFLPLLERNEMKEISKMSEDECKDFFTCKQCGEFDPEDEGCSIGDNYFCQNCVSFEITPITPQ